ncbi:hypothetical protein FS749_007381 [Ceratobasidium sp. UAMH 11750]|nr:hypothetical protein FS749_007381 [Ceratobasidium sp. UAMH 11750]
MAVFSAIASCAGSQHTVPSNPHEDDEWAGPMDNQASFDESSPNTSPSDHRAAKRLELMHWQYKGINLGDLNNMIVDPNQVLIPPKYGAFYNSLQTPALQGPSISTNQQMMPSIGSTTDVSGVWPSDQDMYTSQVNPASGQAWTMDLLQVPSFPQVPYNVAKPDVQAPPANQNMAPPTCYDPQTPGPGSRLYSLDALPAPRPVQYETPVNRSQIQKLHSIPGALTNADGHSNQHSMFTPKLSYTHSHLHSYSASAAILEPTAPKPATKASAPPAPRQSLQLASKPATPSVTSARGAEKATPVTV